MVLQKRVRLVYTTVVIRPARKVPKNYRNATGLISTTKSDRMTAYESRLERDFMKLVGFDPRVSHYVEQPVKIEFTDATGGLRTYTPDIVVTYHTHQDSAQETKPLLQAGYDMMASGGVVAACRIWLDAWADVLRILDKAGFESINDFDNDFRGTQSLFNWIQDLQGELWNAGLRDRRFLASRIAVCEEGLRRFEASDDELLIGNRRHALAESYFELGETAKTEALYRKWLKTDPQWGWGWIGWSDCYRFTRSESRNLKRAEQLLHEGLAVAEVRDSEDISERLADLYEDQRRADEANQIRQHIKIDSAAIRHTLEVDDNVVRQKTTITFAAAGTRLIAPDLLSAGDLRGRGPQEVFLRSTVHRAAVLRLREEVQEVLRPRSNNGLSLFRLPCPQTGYGRRRLMDQLLCSVVGGKKRTSSYEERLGTSL